MQYSLKAFFVWMTVMSVWIGVASWFYPSLNEHLQDPLAAIVVSMLCPAIGLLIVGSLIAGSVGATYLIMKCLDEISKPSKSEKK